MRGQHLSQYKSVLPANQKTSSGSNGIHDTAPFLAVLSRNLMQIAVMFVRPRCHSPTYCALNTVSPLLRFQVLLEVATNSFECV